jgi:hypothetical protein
MDGSRVNEPVNQSSQLGAHGPRGDRMTSWRCKLHLFWHECFQYCLKLVKDFGRRAYFKDKTDSLAWERSKKNISGSQNTIFTHNALWKKKTMSNQDTCRDAELFVHGSVIIYHWESTVSYTKIRSWDDEDCMWMFMNVVGLAIFVLLVMLVRRRCNIQVSIWVNMPAGHVNSNIKWHDLSAWWSHCVVKICDFLFQRNIKQMLIHNAYTAFRDSSLIYIQTVSLPPIGLG